MLIDVSSNEASLGPVTENRKSGAGVLLWRRCRFGRTRSCWLMVMSLVLGGGEVINEKSDGWDRNVTEENKHRNTSVQTNKLVNSNPFGVSNLKVYRNKRFIVLRKNTPQ